MKTLSKIVMLTPSLRWRSTLEFHLQRLARPVKILPAQDFQAWIRDIEQFQPAVAIMELEPELLLELGKNLHQRLVNYPPTIFIGLGEPNLKPWLRFLRSSGFAEVCLEISQVGKLSSQIGRHLQAVADSRNLTLETLIQDSLPW